MSAPSSKPSVPRPTVRKTAPPPAVAPVVVAPVAVAPVAAAPVVAAALPAVTVTPIIAVEAAPVSKASIPPSSPAIQIPQGYAGAPPVIRNRMPTLELVPTFELEADELDDLVEEQPAALVRRSTPPPAPPSRSTVAPKLTGIESSVPKIAPNPVPAFGAIDAAPESRVQLKPVAVQSFAPVHAAPAAQVAPAVQAAAVQAAPVQAVVAAVPVAPVQAFAPVQAAPKPKLESMLDPSEALFDGMYELNYADSQWAAARLCAQALGRALGARTVIVHAHDLATRELRTIGVHGEGEFDLLGSSDGSEDDLVASAVICNEKPVTMRFDGELPRLAPKRLGMISAPRTLVAVPAMAWGRCVALIEIIDADERLASRVADSAAYVAERLAEFLSERAAA